MPTYSVKLGDGHSYKIKSPTELSSEQIQQYVLDNPDQFHTPTLDERMGQTRGLGETISDSAIGILQGGANVAEGLYGAATALGSDKAAGMLPYIQQYNADLGSNISDPMQARMEYARGQAKAAEGTGFWNETKAGVTPYLTNPSLMIQEGFKQAPQFAFMGATGKTAQGIGRVVAPALNATKVGTAGAIAGGVTQQSGSVASESYKRTFDAARRAGLNDAQAHSAAMQQAQEKGALGAVASLATYAIPGSRGIESALVSRAAPSMAGGFIRQGVRPTAKTVAKVTGGEMAQEYGEEGSGAVLANMAEQSQDPSVSPYAGAATRAATGATIAGPFGFGAGVKNHYDAKAAYDAIEKHNEGYSLPAPNNKYNPSELIPMPDGSVMTMQDMKSNVDALRKAGKTEEADAAAKFYKEQVAASRVAKRQPEAPTEQSSTTIDAGELEAQLAGINAQIESATADTTMQPDAKAHYLTTLERLKADVESTLEMVGDTTTDEKQDVTADGNTTEAENNGPKELPAPTGKKTGPSTELSINGVQTTEGEVRMHINRLQELGKKKKAKKLRSLLQKALGRHKAAENLEASKAAHNEAGALRKVIEQIDADPKIHPELKTVLTQQQQIRLTDAEKRAAKYRQSLRDKELATIREQSAIPAELTPDVLRAVGVTNNKQIDKIVRSTPPLNTVEGRKALHTALVAANEKSGKVVTDSPLFKELDAQVQSEDYFHLTDEPIEATQATPDADTLLQKYSAARDIGDERMEAIADEEGKTTLGAKQWGNLKATLKRKQKTQAKQLGEEAAGLREPKQMDLLIGVNKESARRKLTPRPETKPEPEQKQEEPDDKPVVNAETSDTSTVKEKSVQEESTPAPEKKEVKASEPKQEPVGDSNEDAPAKKGKQSQPPTKAEIDEFMANGDKTTSQPITELQQVRATVNAARTTLLGDTDIANKLPKAAKNVIKVLLDKAAEYTTIASRATNTPAWEDSVRIARESLEQAKSYAQDTLNKSPDDVKLANMARASRSISMQAKKDAAMRKALADAQMAEEAAKKNAKKVEPDMTDAELEALFSSVDENGNESIDKLFRKAGVPMGKPLGYTNAADFIDGMKKHFGPALEKAVAAGKVIVHDSSRASTLSAETSAYLRRLKADGDPVTGFVAANSKGHPVVHIIAEDVNTSNDLKTLVHEAGVHAGWVGVLGEDSFNREVGRIKKAIANDNPSTPYDKTVKLAYESIKDNYKGVSEDVMAEEVMAHIAEHGKSLPLARRLLTALKKWFHRFSLNNFGALEYNASDIKVLAAHVAKNWMLGNTNFAERVLPDAQLNRVESDGVRTMTDVLEEVGFNLDTTHEDTPGVIKNMMSQSPSQLREKAANYMDRFMTAIFSSNAGLMREAQRQLRASNASEDEVIGTLLSISDSQALHSTALATGFLDTGKLSYDEGTSKWTLSEDSNNFKTLVTKISEAAVAHGTNMEKMRGIANAAFIARRYKALYDKKESIVAELESLDDIPTNRDRITKLTDALNRMSTILGSAANPDNKGAVWTEELIDRTIEAYNEIPELNEAFNIWDGMRKNLLDFAVESGTMSKEKADSLFMNAGYIPFYRIREIREGPQNMRVTALNALNNDIKQRHLEGSGRDVEDVFKNIETLVDTIVNAGVNNRVSQNIIKAVEKWDGAKLVSKDGKRSPDYDGSPDPARVVDVYENGELVKYEMDNPLIVQAFSGAESLVDPVMGMASKFTNMLRKSIVLNPVFTASQLSQDAISAMMSSGLPLKQAVRIPGLVLKEFVKTIRGTSSTHDYLKTRAAVGRHDYTNTMAHEELEVLANLVEEKTLRAKAVSYLENWSMASDNAVRQAVYIAAKDSVNPDGTPMFTEAQAIESAFELINFRRRGSSRYMSWASNFVPFWSAWIQANNVAIKVLTGEGINARGKKDFEPLIKAVAMNMALASIYTLMMQGDPDYEEADDYVRNRMIMIPGTGGFGIPMRTDFTFLPKVITEQVIRYITNENTQDGANARAAIGNAMATAVLGPTAVPQFIKPITEVVLNKNFHTGRDLIPKNLQTLDTNLQYDANTSEFSKAIGYVTGHIGLSPVDLDHIITGYTGTTGAMALLAMDLTVGQAAGRAAPRWRDVANKVASRFADKEYGTGMKSDIYDLFTEVNKVHSTFTKLVNEDPDAAKDYIADERRRKLFGAYSAVNSVVNTMRKNAAFKRKIALSSGIDSDRRREILNAMDEAEQRMLRALPIMKLRAAAGYSRF